MANENIGEIDCTVRIRGYIRKKKAGKYPLYVSDKQFSNLFFQTELGQDFILENCSMYGADGEPGKEGETEKPGAIYPAPVAPAEKVIEKLRDDFDVTTSQDVLDEVISGDDLVNEPDETGFIL